MNYPRTVQEVQHAEKYKPEVLAAVREFRRSKPWRGTIAERKVKFQALHAALCAVYGLRAELQFRIGETETERGNGLCIRGSEGFTLILQGKLSVVTYLHEFAHAAFGRSERKAVEWSVNLYTRMFPRSAAAMTTEGHLIVKPSTGARAI